MKLSPIALAIGLTAAALQASAATPAGTSITTDTIPANTTYHVASALTVAATTQGLVVAPGAGLTGTVQASVGILIPNASAKMPFGERINP